jgi:hypothetical protein
VRPDRIIILISLLGLAACTTTTKMDSLSLGMSKSAVINVMGQPDSTAAKGDIEVLRYELCRNGCMEFYNYYVKLKDGKVDSYGKMGKKTLHMTSTSATGTR